VSWCFPRFHPTVPGATRPRPRSRALLLIAIAASASVHLGIIFGVRPAPKKALVLDEEYIIPIRLVVPDLKDLDLPEPEPTDGGPQEEAPSLVPMQQDVLQLPKPTDFVQQFDASSLLEQPDFSDMKVRIIPENFQRGSGKLAESIGNIFNLADLDRHPEPVFQPAPAMPHEAKREGISGEVRVQFVVNTEGRVVDAFVVESTDRRFNDAAVVGVSKWKFRPGMKAGKKVNSRMAVPIVFTMTPATS
jgi:periplasmic protein TonB